MSSSPPSPNSPIPGAPPPPTDSPPPQIDSPPPPAVTDPPPPQSPPSVSSPLPDLSTASPPPAGGAPPQPPAAISPPPPDPSSAPPPQLNSYPPPVTISPPIPVSPPTASPPPSASPPPPTSLSPPPQPPTLPPPTTSPPPPNRPATIPPPPSPSDPTISPPPPATNPPPILESPPPQSLNSTPPPPPPSRTPPESSPPPPLPPINSPPPPSPRPPVTIPPPPSNISPQNSPPPPARKPPGSSPPPPPPNFVTPPIPPASPPSLNPPQILSPPPVLRTSPPPPSTVSPPSFSPPPLPSVPPANPNTNSSTGTPNSQSSNGAGIGTGGTVAIALVLSVVFLGIFGTAACCVWKRKKKTNGQNGGHILPTTTDTSPESGSKMSTVQTSASSNANDPGGFGNSRSWFTYEELVEATNAFSAKNLLGEGGFGFVYKGRLADDREVAVKQLKVGGRQGEREFKSEVEIISRIHHRHLVTLVGYCISEEKRLLVYEFVPNNTLHFHLHGRGRPVMSWTTRVRIAVGAARGIAYLHEDCHPRIIHRDIKSSNILLDNNFEARVSDFGLAKLAMDANTHITTRVMGTFGYMAPEYASSGKLTDKSDVYSFGVMLLELISGRKPVDTSQPLGEESLVEWARPLLSHALETQEFDGLVDPRLEQNYIDSEMFRMIEAAASCVRHSAAKRPKMGQIVRAFDSVDKSNGIKVGESEVFNSAQQSEEIRLFQRMAFGSRDYSTDFFSQNSWSSEGNQINSSYESTFQSFSNQAS